ncbi:MAG: type II toxin-antitoxin system prevent-host-death family antitoxin [Coriobacteriia bacterium]|nr:type II toxin-antitoxin system prevent-host-death family antitoxin [Coriobacteriia bacterium]
MVQFPIAEAKSRFSEVLKIVESGSPVAITRGKKREVVAYFIHPSEYEKPAERKLGDLEHWGEITFSDDWKMTDEEFLAS